VSTIRVSTPLLSRVAKPQNSVAPWKQRSTIVCPPIVPIASLISIL
jgi:hypothetical protein